MDRVLSTSACPFDSHAESVTAFSRALYALRLEDGRHPVSGTAAEGRFYDPHFVYYDPPVSTIRYEAGDAAYAGVTHVDAIPSSFGVDLLEVILEPTANGRPLTVQVQSTPGAPTSLAVEVWELSQSEEKDLDDPASRLRSRLRARKAATLDGELSYTIPVVDTTETSRLGLVITRVDAAEARDPVGAYTVIMR
jgi:hypothetical protein